MTEMTMGLGKILVVDDEDHNRLLIRDLLENEGHQVFEAKDAYEALEIIEEREFDLLLLDVMMPGMDGFELCKRIQAQQDKQLIPILLLTALNDQESRIKGIQSGALDYLTKPIDIRELPSRVRNYVHSKSLSDKLQDCLLQLNELTKLRENLTEMMVHDLRTPLMGLLNSLELLQMRSGNILSEKESLNVHRSRHMALTLIEMVSSILDVSRFEAGSMPLSLESHDLREIAQTAVESLGEMPSHRSIELMLPGHPCQATCDKEIIRRVLVNLLGNALKFTPRNGRIKLSIEADSHQVQVSVFNSGAVIPEEDLESIFGKFQQVKMRQSGHRYSTGLGLTFCKLALDAHSGVIGVNSEEAVGTTFSFKLFKDEQKDKA